MRRVSAVDLMLLGTVLLWALNITVTRYVVSHGFRPLAYSATRYCSATLLFWCFTWRREGSFRIARRDLRLVGVAAGLIFLNQITFVTSVHLTSASTVGLVLGTTPIFVGIAARLIGLEHPKTAFWVAAVVSLVGVGLIAAGANGGFSGNLLGNLLALAVPITWSGYSVAITPLMRRYSPYRISAVVLALGCLPLVLVGLPELSRQGVSGFGWTMALAFGFAVIGPLFLTNILWFTAISHVGPSRSALFANLEPFFAVLFAVVLLSETLNGWEIAGGVGISIGIVLERIAHRASEPEAIVVLGE